MLERIWPEFQCLKGQGRNSSVRKDRVGFQCLKGQGRNSSVRKDRGGIPILERIGPDIQC